jgi:hypothetical protein
VVNAPAWVTEELYKNGYPVETEIFVYSDTADPNNQYRYPRIYTFNNSTIVSDSWSMQEACNSGDTVELGVLNTKTLSVSCRYPDSSFKYMFVKVKQTITNPNDSSEKYSVYPIVGYISTEQVDKNEFTVQYTIVDMVTYAINQDVKPSLVNPVIAVDNVLQIWFNVMSDQHMYCNSESAPGKYWRLDEPVYPNLGINININNVLSAVGATWKLSDFLKHFGETIGCNYRMSKRTTSDRFPDAYIYPAAESYIECVPPKFVFPGTSAPNLLYPSNTTYPHASTYNGFDAFPQAVSVIDIPWYINSRAAVEHFVGYPLFRVYKGDTLLWSEGNYYAGQSYDVTDNPIVNNLPDITKMEGVAVKLLYANSCTGNLEFVVPLNVEAGDLIRYKLKDGIEITLPINSVSTSGTHTLIASTSCTLESTKGGRI